MTSRYLYLSWVMLLAAVLLWSLFGYIVWRIGVEREQYATLISDITINEQRERAAMRLRGVLRDTQEDRTNLEGLVNTDLIAAVSTIEAAGESAGAFVTTDTATNEALSDGLQSITIIGSANGSLSELLRTIELFETLPFPATLESADVEAPAQGTEWELRYRIRFITTSSSNL